MATIATATLSPTLSPLLSIPDAMVAPPDWSPTRAPGLAIKTPYELDPFQKHAVNGIHAGDHVFVTAKTGSGKTFVGEYLIAYHLAKGNRVFYTTPIKTLSNQKYHDLKKLFPTATVGIMTGDIKMCPQAQIIVMTAEILRNLLYKVGTETEGVGLTAELSLDGVGGIVMDEAHYIQDPDRGHVWEETLILLGPTLRPVAPVKEPTDSFVLRLIDLVKQQPNLHHKHNSVLAGLLYSLCWGGPTADELRRVRTDILASWLAELRRFAPGNVVAFFEDAVANPPPRQRKQSFVKHDICCGCDDPNYLCEVNQNHDYPLGAAVKIQLVLLSATLPSAPTLASWLADVHGRPTRLLSTTYRIVPLVHGILTTTGTNTTGTNTTVSPFLDAYGTWTDAYSLWLRGRKATADAAAAFKRSVATSKRAGFVDKVSPDSKVREETPTARLLRTLSWLRETGNLPALFFLFSRRECERYAALVPDTLLDSSETAAVKHIIGFHLSRYREHLEHSAQYHTLCALLARGIGFHHSGLQPLLKEIVEILFVRGFVRVLFATETFAVGLNMPTKTVVFLELEKWCGGGSGGGGSGGGGSGCDNCRRLLRPDEYIQMAGRAGRRGLDTRGLVLYEPMREPIEPHDFKGLLTGGLLPLQSQMRFHYDFVIKMLLGHRSHSQHDIVNKSYWALEQKNARAALQKEIESLRSRVPVSDPREHDILEEHDRLQREVNTSTNSRQKKAKQALALWMSQHDSKDLSSRLAHYKHQCELRTTLARLEADAAAFDSAPLLNLEPLLAFLKEIKFLDDSGTLTQFGVAASEVNEGHQILMPILTVSSRMMALTAEETAVVLASFLIEGSGGRGGGGGGSDGFTPVQGDCVQDVLRIIESQRQLCIGIETSVGVNSSPPYYWKTSDIWPAIVQHWVMGASIPQIAKECDMFEGNIIRGLLRVSNILEEWNAMAKVRNDLVTLEKMAGFCFLRGELTPDSLYLRL